jgi:hypothetical protein
MKKSFDKFTSKEKFKLAYKIGDKFETRKISDYVDIIADLIFYKDKVIARLERNDDFSMVYSLEVNDNVLKNYFIQNKE